MTGQVLLELLAARDVNVRIGAATSRRRDERAIDGTNFGVGDGRLDLCSVGGQL